jgi:hypothetical protein
MRGGRHVLVSAQRRVCRRRLPGRHVDADDGDAARGERFGKSRLVGDQYASRLPEVDGGVHPTEHLGVD